MTFQTYTTTHETETGRVRWVYDEEYDPEGSYALDTEEETARAVAEEEEGLRSGNLVALGAIVETRCGEYSQWVERESLWGIVVSVDDDLAALGNEMLDLSAPPRLS